MQISNTTTLIVTYVFSVANLVLIFTRLLWRFSRRKQEKVHTDDLFMGLSIVPLLLRLGCNHVVLTYGTNNVNNPESLTPQQIETRVIGSKMVLAVRICYAVL